MLLFHVILISGFNAKEVVCLEGLRGEDGRGQAWPLKHSPEIYHAFVK